MNAVVSLNIKEIHTRVVDQNAQQMVNVIETKLAYDTNALIHALERVAIQLYVKL